MLFSTDNNVVQNKQAKKREEAWRKKKKINQAVFLNIENC